MPPRSLMWCKGSENKAHEIQYVNVKIMAEKLVEHEKQIKDGDLKLDPGMDAMSLVFVKDNDGFLKGVGTCVTTSRYFNIPITKGSSKEQIVDLKFELQNERLELQKKDEELKAFSTKVKEQDKTLEIVLAHLESQGKMIPNLTSHPNQSPTQVFSVDKNVQSHASPITNTITEKAQITDKTLTNEPVTRTMKTIKCILEYPNNRSNVAYGTVYISSERQVIHGVPLQDDCYKISIDEVIKGDAFLPYQNGDIKTVEEAHQTFVAWPKYIIKYDEKIPHMRSTQNDNVKAPRSKKHVYNER
ncbi:unnamed protein product [Lactuca saligna]|uniref:DUF8039 domain-containing protein n=1 Tax=Lactuca saligna TaxID=75948 RepID=A0AA35YQ40_LACSI|nr:unnamed protein product [Lactuca saligna]